MSEEKEVTFYNKDEGKVEGEVEGEPIVGVRPCGYCGNNEQKKFRLVERKVHWSGKPYFQFECSKCGARGPMCKDAKDAIDSWQQSRKV